MTPTARAMSYEVAKDVERCCIECYRNDCDCDTTKQQAPEWVHSVRMYNDGPHDSMNAPVEEIRIETPAHIKEVQDERCSVYGDSQYNLGGFAQAINGYLTNKWQMKLPSPITEFDAAMLMELGKVIRMARTPGHEDSMLDAHSYLDLAAKAVQR